jgi:pimeloyl-ACP methyl ester carboxylesterase
VSLSRRALALAFSGVALSVFCSSARIARAQTPPAAFREEPVTAAIAGGQLSGTLLLPNGAGPFPVALIIAGSGPTDRDGNNEPNGLATDAYKKLAEGLAAQGIATLRYDKRGVGMSKTVQSESDLRFDDYVGDALVLCAVLERDSRFGSVSIVGHSEGSLIGMIAAQRDAHVHAFVSLEGAGRTVAAILEEQMRSNPNVPPALINEVQHINASLLAGKPFPDPDPMLDAVFRPSVQPYLISWYKYDPAHEIAKVRIPVLIVQGTTDLQVGTGDAKLLAAANPQAKLTLLDGMNHMLVDAPADRAANLATYTEPALPLNAELVPAVANALKP